MNILNTINIMNINKNYDQLTTDELLKVLELEDMLTDRLIGQNDQEYMRIK